MVCEHLSMVEKAILDAHIPVTFRGQAWSKNCREWVYFDAYLYTKRIIEEFHLSEFVIEHSHRGTHDGQEHGLVCTKCHDAIMGLHQPMGSNRTFPS